jgi:hypothetical protein
MDIIAATREELKETEREREKMRDRQKESETETWSDRENMNESPLLSFCSVLVLRGLDDSCPC